MSERKIGQDRPGNEDRVAETMSAQDQRKNGARRKILRNIVVGGGAMTAARAVPEHWSRPVVDSVVLPGHAATSVAGGGGPVPVGTFVSGSVVVDNSDPFEGTQFAEAAGEPDSISEELLEFFMPSAHAQQAQCNASCKVVFHATVEQSRAAICFVGSVSGSASCTVVPGNPPSLRIVSRSGPISIGSARFQGEELRLTLESSGVLHPNAVTQVTMTRGGPGCP